MRYMLTLGLVFECSRAGRERKKFIRDLEGRLESEVSSSLSKLFAGAPYAALVSGRTRSHIFIELRERTRTIQPAEFPSDKEWCQLCNVDVVEEEFLALSPEQQVETICDTVRRSVDRYLSAPAKKKRERAATDWELSYPIDSQWGSDADLEMRYRIEEVLDSELDQRELGACDGGSIGGSTMEVFISLDKPMTRTRLTKLLQEILPPHDLPLPQEMTPDE